MGNSCSPEGNSSLLGRAFHQLIFAQPDQYNEDSKEKLVQEYVQLKIQLIELNNKYDDIYSTAVETAATEHSRCKHPLVLLRKHEIKDIIKESVWEAVMEKFDQQPNSTKQSRGGLLGAARQFAEAADKVRVSSEIQLEVKDLTTEQLERQIRQIKGQIKLKNEKLEHLHRELMSLYQRYEETREMPLSLRRYLARKRILKSFITENSPAIKESPYSVVEI